MEFGSPATNWTIFGAIAIGLVYYYTARGKQAPRPAPLKEVKKDIKSEVKKTARKAESAAKKQAPSIAAEGAPKPDTSSKGTAKNKRKGDTQSTPEAPAVAAVQEDDEDALDMSTRQFAANMIKARDGVDMKKAENKETRVKTVKAKTMDSPVLSIGSSQNGDAADEWSQVASPALKSTGIDDMLEPTAPGPSALRITAPLKPVKEKVIKQQPKQAAPESKKQRQNRRKNEEAKFAREQAEGVRKLQQEQQRRTAREGRGEAARNGIAISAAPAQNAWLDQNTAREVQLPVKAGENSQLLDTFDAESTSSSNADRISTAATSTTDAPADGNQSEEDDYAKAIAESERETGWNEVKKTKKNKKNAQSEMTGNATPVAVPVAKAASTPASTKTASNGKPVGFQALKDEYEVTDPSDADNWAV